MLILQASRGDAGRGCLCLCGRLDAVSDRFDGGPETDRRSLFKESFKTFLFNKIKNFVLSVAELARMLHSGGGTASDIGSKRWIQRSGE